MAATSSNDRVDLLRVEVGRREQHVQALCLHAVDEVGNVARSRGDSRLGLDIIRTRNAEAFLEVHPVLVVADHALTTKALRRL